MITRYSKIALVCAAAFFATLVVFNNVTDYGSNFAFVSHVLMMDTTFPDNGGMWRAINSPVVFHLIYVMIILTEAAVAALCWLGGVRLFRARHKADRFNQEKGFAIAGLTLGMILWFTGFITVGGEWFLMWQSDIWNGNQAAFRIVMVLGIILVYLVQPDRESNA